MDNCVSSLHAFLFIPVLLQGVDVECCSDRSDVTANGDGKHHSHRSLTSLTI